MELRCFAAAESFTEEGWSGPTLTQASGVRALFPSFCGIRDDNLDGDVCKFASTLVDSVQRSGVEARTDAYILFVTNKERELNATTTGGSHATTIAESLASLVGLKSRDVEGKKNYGRKVEIKLGVPAATSTAIIGAATVSSSFAIPNERRGSYLGGIDSWQKFRTKNSDGTSGGVTNVPAVISWLQTEKASLQVVKGQGVASSTATVNQQGPSSTPPYHPATQIELLDAAIEYLQGGDGCCRGTQRLYVCVIDKKRRQSYLPGTSSSLVVEETDVRAELKVYMPPPQSSSPSGGQWVPTTEGDASCASSAAINSPYSYFRTWAVEGHQVTMADDGGSTIFDRILRDWKKNSGATTVVNDVDPPTTVVNARVDPLSDVSANTTTVNDGPSLVVGSYPGFLTSWFQAKL